MPTERGSAVAGVNAANTITINTSAFSTAPQNGDIIVAFVFADDSGAACTPAPFTPNVASATGLAWTNKAHAAPAAAPSGLTLTLFQATANGTAGNLVTFSTPGGDTGNYTVILVAYSSAGAPNYGAIQTNTTASTSPTTPSIGSTGDRLSTMFAATTAGFPVLATPGAPTGETSIATETTPTGLGTATAMRVSSETLGTPGTRTASSWPTEVANFINWGVAVDIPPAATGATATGSITLSGSAAAQAAATAAGSLTLSGTVTGAAAAAAAGSITLSGSAAAQAAATAAGSLTLSGSVTGAAAAAAAGSITLSGSVAVSAAEKVWNGAAFLAATVKAWTGAAWSAVTRKMRTGSGTWV